MPLVESEICHPGPCPINCVVSDWGVWGGCSAVCQGGTKIRRRQVTTASKYGGTECPKLEESRTCNTRLCTLQDRRKCSHIKCKYRAHTAARERAVFNFPETVRPFHDKGAGHHTDDGPPCDPGPKRRVKIE